MGKKQKSISIPIEFWEDLEETYEKYREELHILDINSSSELIRVLVNLGKPRLPEILEAIHKSRMKITESQKKP